MIDGTAIVLQARMGSRRLPGKTLARIAGRSVLEHCIERLQAASDMRVILATTTRAEDDCLEHEGRRLGVEVVRGPDEDVLGRFVLVASTFSLTDLVRATADNPAVDMDAPRRVLSLLRSTQADHVCERDLPYGTGVEAIAAAALVRAAELTADRVDREHVTLFVQRDRRFRTRQLLAPEAVRRPDLRLSVDTAEDLTFVRNVLESAERERPRPVPLTTLIATATRLMETVSIDH